MWWLHAHPVILAVLTGFVLGVILCIPVGPINLTIINEGARRGFTWAFLIGLGSTAMAVLYCSIAFTGFSSLFGHRYIKAGMEVFSFAFLIFLGIKFLMARSVEATNKIEERIEEKLHPHSAFMIGFVRTMGNPGVLVFWIILAANLISGEWVPANGAGRFACITGVAAGCLVWFTGLSWAVSRGHKKFSDKTLLRMEHYSGIGLLVLGFAHGLRLVWQLARHKM
jgi:threonine/homoserine/homoserine lactone efflux protein